MRLLGGLTRIQSSFLTVGILLMVAVMTLADENKLESVDGSEQDGQSHDVGKRYVAALAKSGRLPKYLVSQKRAQDSGEETGNGENTQDHLITELTDGWQNEKRHVGSFLRAHGNPAYFKPRNNRELPTASSERDETSLEGLENLTPWELQKRNVASLARLGRLNAIRYASFAPRSAAGNKRVYFYDDHLNDGNSVEEEVKEEDTADCEEEEENWGNDEGDNNSHDNHLGPNWTQQKRYIAALARSGRLPVWHTQRSWWGGKRDKPTPYWMTYRSGARAYGNKRINTSTSDHSNEAKNKRCKKSQDIYENKRNLAMLARKGLLPIRPYVSA